MLSHNTSLQYLTLRPLIEDAMDDECLALALAQQSLISLEIYRAFTQGVVDILRRECDGLQMLQKLQAIGFIVDALHEDAVVALLDVVPSLVVLDTFSNLTAEIGP